MQRSLPDGFALDPVPIYEIEHDRGPIAQQVQEPRSEFGAQCVGQHRGHDPHACIHEPDIASRRPEADLVASSNAQLAPFHLVQRRRRAGETAANDRHVHGQRLAQRLRGRRGRGRGFPQTVSTGITAHDFTSTDSPQESWTVLLPDIQWCMI